MINSNEYSVIHPFDEPEKRKKFDFHGEQDPYFVNVDNHEFLGKTANPVSIVNYAHSLKSPGNWITLVGLTGSRNKLFRAGSEIPMPKLDELNGPQGIRTLAAIRRFARLTGSARVVPVVPAGTFEGLNEGQRLFLSEAFYNNAFHDLIDENGQSFAIKFGLKPRNRNAEKEFGVQPTIRSRG